MEQVVLLLTVQIMGLPFISVTIQVLIITSSFSSDCHHSWPVVTWGKSKNILVMHVFLVFYKSLPGFFSERLISYGIN